MKRASSRLGSQALTLSLLSSMVLLAACGGGGKDEPAAAAPAAVPSGPVETPQVPDPTLADVTAADEPYIAAVSSIAYDQSIDPTPPAYQISILDGKTQTVLHKISFDKSPTQKWLTVNKIEREFKVLADPDKANTNLPGTFVVETDKGPTHLYYIDGKVVRHLDLSRQTVAKPIFTANQVSSLTEACQLAESYPLKLDGSSSALVVITAGPDQDCDTAADNARVVITSDDGTDVAPRTLALPDAKLIKRIYNAGTLTGVLVQDAIPKSVQSQLSILSPTMDTVLRSPLELPINGSVITSFPSTSPLGAEWLADAPNKDSGEGYLRLQRANYSLVFKLVWDEAKQTATLTLEHTFQGTQASVKSINDGTYTYFAFNTVAYRGPMAGATKPFEVIHAGLDNPSPGMIPRFQTKTHVVYTQGEPATSGWAVPKTPGKPTKLFESRPNLGAPIQLVGQRGNTLVVLGKDSFDTVGLGVATIDIGEAAGNNLTFAQVHNVALVAPAWSAKRVNGLAQVETLVVRAAGGGAFNTVDLANMKFGISLGDIDAPFADDAPTVVANQNGLASLNSRFDVTMKLYGYETRQDPWLFNLGVKDSLKQIDTWAEVATQ